MAVAQNADFLPITCRPIRLEKNEGLKRCRFSYGLFEKQINCHLKTFRMSRWHHRHYSVTSHYPTKSSDPKVPNLYKSKPDDFLYPLMVQLTL